MIILKKCEKINIVIDDNDLMNGQATFKILYNQRTYDSVNFRCQENKDIYLYPQLRKEYEASYAEALAEFNRLKEMYGPKPKQEDPFGMQLQNLMLKVLAEQSAEKVLELAKPMLNDHIQKTYGILPQVVEVKTPTTTHQIKGATHEKLKDVLNLVSLDIPVFLSGPAGSGKNVICKQVAESLGLEFYFTNAVTQEYKLTGFIDANGNYQETQFYKAFKDGGLFFLDEMDASIPDVLIILNAAIANRYFDFPNGKIEAHENFRVIAAGNTFGTGADIEYSGRFQLDAASLDRFALIEIDYSPNIEKAITNNNDDLLDFCHSFRKICKNSGIICLFSYRTLERIFKLENVFESLSDVIQMSLTKGLSKDDIKVIYKGFDFSNKYTKALKTLAA